jgi:hypothetical protein
MSATISARELMTAFATPFPSSNSLAPSSGSSYFYSTLLDASPPAASNIPVHELMDAFTSKPLAPIVCPPAVYSRRPCLTPRADGTTVDSLEDIDFDLPVLSVQVVRYTPEQLEEQESSSAPTGAQLFPEYNVCPECKDIKLHCKCEYTLPPGVNSFREYCYQCNGNIMECECEEPFCDKCKWQELSDITAKGFNKCFCDLLIEHGNCPYCLSWECQCQPDDEQDEDEQDEENESDGQDEVFQLPSWRNADMM